MAYNKIDRVSILTLEKHDWRSYICMGGLLARFVPWDLIHIHYGDDAADFSGARVVCEAAADDGFPIFQRLLDSGWHRNLSVAIVAQFWSYMQMFRESADKNITTFWIHDDYLLNHEWRDYQVLVDSVSRMGDWRFILPGYWNREGVEILETSEVGSNGVIKASHGILGGCDVGFIFSPDGAKYFLDIKEFGFSFETHILHLSDTVPFLDGAYTVTSGWSIAPIVEGLHLGSTIHDVKEIERSGKWILLRPPVLDVDRGGAD